MNKKAINEMIDVAYQAIGTVGILNSDKSLNKSYRGQISTFGAAITMGSLPAAVTFFSNKGGSEVDREKLIEAIYQILKNRAKIKNEKNLFDYVKDNGKEKKENVINAAIALKLAMNLYPLK